MKIQEARSQYQADEPLNHGWPLKKISEVADVNPRTDKKVIPDDLEISFVPMPAVGAGDGSIRVDETRTAQEVKKGFTAFLEGDVLFAKITPCMENGKMAVVPPLVNGYGFGSTEFHVLRPKGEVDAKYLYYFVSSQSFRKEAERHMTGAVGQRRVPTTYLKECEIPVPPLDQQKRIVAEIEKQFSRLDEGIDNLMRVQANLKRYKAAVLKAAVEGRLVETEAEIARREGRDFETGEQLLQHILQERRRRWEEAELAKMQAKGKPPKNDKWKQKYKEPAAPDTTNLPELPEGWVWASSVQACSRVVDCHNKTAPYVEKGILLVRTSNIRDGRLLLDDVRYVDRPTYEFWSRRCPPKAGDILFTREAPMGEVAIIPEGMKICMGQRMMLMRPTDSIDTRFLLYCLQSPIVKEWINKTAVGTGVKHLRVGDVERLPLPIPPLIEQHRIVTEVDRRLSILRETEAQVEANLQRAERLRQSILAAAFSGRLVSDDTLDPAA